MPITSKRARGEDGSKGKMCPLSVGGPKMIACRGCSCMAWIPVMGGSKGFCGMIAADLNEIECIPEEELCLDDDII